MTDEQAKQVFQENPGLAMKWGIHFKSEPKKSGCCPECGASNYEHAGGCELCHSCGFSKCG